MVLPLALLGCYAATPLEDQDSDGVKTWMDCNDLDSAVGSAFADIDGDSHGQGFPLAGCNVVDGRYASTGDDCDDNREDTYPGALERCDGRDNDCDGTPDDGISAPDAAMDSEALLDGIDSNCNGSSDSLVTIAGTGECCSAGDGGVASTAIIGYPGGLAFDFHQQLYIAQPEAHRVRRINPDGLISTVAGTGESGFTTNKDATKLLLNAPSGVTVGTDGRVFISDSGNNRVLMIALDGTASTVAGPTDSGETLPPTAECLLNHPNGLSVTLEGRLLIADTDNQRIAALDDFTSRRLSTVIGTYQVVGNRQFSVAGANEAALSTASGSVPGLQNQLQATGILLDHPEGVLALENGDVIVADTGNHRLLRSKTNIGVIDILAGTGISGYSGDGGAGVAAQLSAPSDIALYQSSNMLLDTLLFVADRGNHRIRMLDGSGVIRTVAGTGVAGFSGDDGQATDAMLQFPTAVAVDSQGNLRISDYANHRVRALRW